jgi:hypothetical protein
LESPVSLFCQKIPLSVGTILGDGYRVTVKIFHIDKQIRELPWDE